MMHRGQSLIRRVFLTILLVVLQAAGQVVLAQEALHIHGHCMEHAVHSHSVGDDENTTSTHSDAQMTCCGAFAFLPASEHSAPAMLASARAVILHEAWAAGLRAPPETPPPNI